MLTPYTSPELRSTTIYSGPNSIAHNPNDTGDENDLSDQILPDNCFSVSYTVSMTAILLTWRLDVKGCSGFRLKDSQQNYRYNTNRVNVKAYILDIEPALLPGNETATVLPGNQTLYSLPTSRFQGRMYSVNVTVAFWGTNTTLQKRLHIRAG